MAIIESIGVGVKLPFKESYSDDMELVGFLRTSYECTGTDYTQGFAPDGRIIYKNDCEEKKDYETRCKQTPTRTYVSSILNKYLASVFRNEPYRKIDNDTYMLLYKDADGYGNTLNSIMNSALKNAQIDGRSYLLAESTDTNTEILSIAQKNNSGVRPYIRKLTIENVINYTEIEENLVEAVVLLEDENGETFARYMDDRIFIDIKITDRYVITEISEPYNHGYEKIPLIEIEPYEIPQSKPISYSQRTVCNILSKLVQELDDSVFTKFILSGVRIQQDENETSSNKIVWSGKRIVTIEDPGAKLDLLGSDHGCADSLRKQIEIEEANLYYSAGFGKSNLVDAATNVSGYSLEIQREDFFIYCNKLKDTIESAENKIMYLIAGKEGYEYSPAIYSSRFVADDNGSELQKLRDSLALSLPNTFKRLLIREYINKFYNVNEEDMAKIEKEMSNVAEV